jgi:hypothetical protein
MMQPDDADDLTGYAVDRFGTMTHTHVLEELVQGIDDETLRHAIAEFGLEAVAERYLRTVIADGTLVGDGDAARAEADGMFDTDPLASPRMHAVTVADLADLFTRLGLTEPPSSDYP